MKYENEIFKILCTLSLVTILSIFFINKCNAQTWNASDMNGVSYDLSNYVNKATLVDISASLVWTLLVLAYRRSYGRIIS